MKYLGSRIVINLIDMKLLCKAEFFTLRYTTVSAINNVLQNREKRVKPYREVTRVD